MSESEKNKATCISSTKTVTLAEQKWNQDEKRRSGHREQSLPGESTLACGARPRTHLIIPVISRVVWWRNATSTVQLRDQASMEQTMTWVDTLVTGVFNGTGTAIGSYLATRYAIQHWEKVVHHEPLKEDSS